MDWDLEIAKRRGCAWAALRSVRNIWRSNVAHEIKRKLFQSLVEPIFTYGLIAWPLSKTRRRQLDGTYNRMIRYALGLRAFDPLTNERTHTESLYLLPDDATMEQKIEAKPFLSTMIATRRMSFLAHATREHSRATDPRLHACVLLANAQLQGDSRRSTYKPFSVPTTLVGTILQDMRIEEVNAMNEVFNNRGKCLQRITELRTEKQKTTWTEIHERRLTSQSSESKKSCR